MNNELEPKVELEEERKENEKLTIMEIKKLENLIKEQKEDVTGDSLGIVCVITMIVCLAQLLAQNLRLTVYGSMFAFGLWKLFSDIIPVLEKIKETKAKKEEKEEELEQLRR